MADKDLRYRISAEDSAFKNALERTRTGLSQFNSSIDGMFKGMGTGMSSLVDRIDGLKGVIIGSLVAGAAVAAKAYADRTAEMIESTMDMARALGTTTNEASVLQAALEDVGASPEEFIAASKGLLRQLRENEKGLQDMGLATRDASGNLRPLSELTVSAIAVLNQYREGTDRAVAAQSMFGKGIDGSSRLLLLNGEAIASNRQAVEELGLEVGQSATQAWADYDAAGDRAALSSKAFARAVGESVMPIVTELTEMFNAVMPAAITVTRGALAGLSTFFVSLTNGVRVLWETLNALVFTLAEPIRAVVQALYLAGSGDLKGAGAAIMGVGSNIAGAWEQAMARISESSQKTRDRISNVWGFATGGNAEAGDSQGTAGTRSAKTKPAKPEKESRDPADSYMQTYGAVLDGLKMRYATEHNLREMSGAEEIAYWQELLATYEVTAKDRGAIALRIQRLELDGAKATAATNRQLAEDASAHAREMALAEIDLQQQNAEFSVQLGSTTQAQLLEQEMGFELRRAEIRKQAMLEQQALIDPTRDPVAYAQISQQIEQAEMQHQLALGQIKGQAALQQQQQQSGVFNAMQTGLDALTQSIMQRTLTWRGAFDYVLNSLGQGFAKTISTIAGNWIKGLLQMQTQEKAMTLASVHANAMKAGAAAYQAVVGIPYVGPFLAPAAAAVAYAGTMAFASAEGGYDIPAGVNPMTQLHEREMVLPQEQADVVRDMAASGGGGGGGLVINATPMPGGFFAVHEDEFIRMLERAKRNRRI